MTENCSTISTAMNGAAKSNAGRREEANGLSGCVFVHCEGRKDRENLADLVNTVKVVDLIQSNKSNNGSTCTTGSKCTTRAMIKITGIVAACMVAMALHSSGYNGNHFYDAYDTSNNHTIRAPNELDVDGGGTTSQAKSNGAIILTVAISAVCLVFMAGLIRSMLSIDLR